MNNKANIPSQLWEGNQEQLQDEAVLFLQKQFCINKETCEEKAFSSCFCNECQKIKQKQHTFILWICPQKNYSVEDIAIVFEKIRFSLESDQSFFFVLEKTNTLNRTCANRLLKSLEEPPAGYNFILLTNNIDLILPTIQSRCLIKQFQSNDLTEHPLLSFFTTENRLFDPTNFTGELKKHSLTDNESTELLNVMLCHFTKNLILLYKSETKEDPKEMSHLKKITSFLKDQMFMPPQSGSSNIFWKNLYVNFPRR